MKNFCFYRKDGKIISAGQCVDADFDKQNLGDEFEKLELDFPMSNVDVYYIADGAVLHMPEKPTEFHEFDYSARCWKPSQSKAVFFTKRKRQYLLQQSDWTQLSDISAETKALWEPYRQALRDITDQPGYPYDIVWPTPPQ